MNQQQNFTYSSKHLFSIKQNLANIFPHTGYITRQNKINNTTQTSEWERIVYSINSLLDLNRWITNQKDPILHFKQRYTKDSIDTYNNMGRGSRSVSAEVSYYRNSWTRLHQYLFTILYERKCSFCFKRELTVIHHTYYTNDSLEHPDSFKLLCNRCHHSYHNNISIPVYEYGKLVDYVNPFKN